jgi:hypothetical protein
MTGGEQWIDSDSGIAAELEAFLTGRYSEWLLDRGEPVPAWAHLNRLAHSSPEAVLGIACHASQWREPCASDWDEALELIAQAIDDVAEGRLAAVAAVQRVVLVPLELQLAMKADTPLRPGQLAGLAWAALQRSTCTRPSLP